MTIYNVHLYALVRVRIDGIEAEDQLGAIGAAIARQDLDRLFNSDDGRIEFADDIPSALVDEAGDAEYERTLAYDQTGAGWKPAQTGYAVKLDRPDWQRVLEAVGMAGMREPTEELLASIQGQLPDKDVVCRACGCVHDTAEAKAGVCLQCGVPDQLYAREAV